MNLSDISVKFIILFFYLLLFLASSIFFINYQENVIYCDEFQNL